MTDLEKARRWAYLWRQEAQIKHALTKDLSEMWRVLYRRCAEQEIQIETLEARVAELAKKNKQLMKMGFDRFDQSQ